MKKKQRETDSDLEELIEYEIKINGQKITDALKKHRKTLRENTKNISTIKENIKELEENRERTSKIIDEFEGRMEKAKLTLRNHNEKFIQLETEIMRANELSRGLAKETRESMEKEQSRIHEKIIEKCLAPIPSIEERLSALSDQVSFLMSSQGHGPAHRESAFLPHNGLTEAQFDEKIIKVQNAMHNDVEVIRVGLESALQDIQQKLLSIKPLKDIEHGTDEIKPFPEDAASEYYAQYLHVNQELETFKKSIVSGYKEDEMKNGYVNYQTRLAGLEEANKKMGELFKNFSFKQEGLIGSLKILQSVISEKLRVKMQFPELEDNSLSESIPTKPDSSQTRCILKSQLTLSTVSL